jgi:hypothetical protein
MSLCNCGNRIRKERGSGRKRSYCCDACRAKAYRERVKHHEMQFRNDIPFLNQIVLGDCRTLSLAIPNESIDCIFTDPPYEKKFLPLYTWLAKEAARILKPHGFLLTYAGSAWKYEVMLSLGKHLTYFWDYIALDAGAGTIVWNRKTLARHKSILAFVKGEGKPRCNTLGVWTGTGADKKYHVWGQDESTARYYIDCFTQPGAIVYDPFCGGGTVPFVCQQLGRSFIAFDSNPQSVAIARERVHGVIAPKPARSNGLFH